LTLDKIIIARTDSIGDVMLTLPLCGLIKKVYPKVDIIFIGRNYTRAVIECCGHVHQFISYDDLLALSSAEQCDSLKAVNANAIIHVFPNTGLMKVARTAKIPLRIATGHRLSAWLYCNQKVFFSRKKSKDHESQLNCKLLAPIGITKIPDLKNITNYYGFSADRIARTEKISYLAAQFNSSKKKIILHPFSKGSAVEWGIDNFKKLSDLLSSDHYEIFLTGTAAEGDKIKSSGITWGNHVSDISGQLNLAEFIAFISKCDAIVAASTGPLHIAAALGIQAIGLYTPKPPMHPVRWAPIGSKATALVANEHPDEGAFLGITPQQVLGVIV
jgi:heptosyltransferase III